MNATSPLILLGLAAASVLVFAAFALWERYEERDVEPCRHCTPGVHWHFGAFCPSSPRGSQALHGQAPSAAAAQGARLPVGAEAPEFSGGGAVGPRPPAGPSLGPPEPQPGQATA